MTVAVADLIERRKDDLLALWLDEIVAGLRKDVPSSDTQSFSGGSRAGTARAHGAQRFHTGFSLETMVHEYEVLRECILDIIEDGRMASASPT